MRVVSVTPSRDAISSLGTESPVLKSFCCRRARTRRPVFVVFSMQSSITSVVHICVVWYLVIVSLLSQVFRVDNDTTKIIKYLEKLKIGEETADTMRRLVDGLVSSD